MASPTVLSTKQLLSQRTQHLIKALVETDFFGPALPSLNNLVQSMRLPRNMIQDSLVALEQQGVIRQQTGSWHRVLGTNHLKAHKFGILTQTDLFRDAYGVYQDYLLGVVEMCLGPDHNIKIVHELSTLEAKVIAVQELAREGVKTFAILGQAEEELRKYIVDHNFTAVVCGNYNFDQNELLSVRSDNFGGMRKMVRHVIDMGHTDIAYYTSYFPRHDGFVHRYLGYKHGMEAANLKTREDLVFSEPLGPGYARMATEVFMSLAQRPSAIICSSDRNAHELIAELQHSGIVVPRHVSVAGFDNSLLDAITETSLTTMQINAREMGRLSGKYLLELMREPGMPLSIIVPTALTVRGSIQQLC